MKDLERERERERETPCIRTEERGREKRVLRVRRVEAASPTPQTCIGAHLGLRFFEFPLNLKR